MTPDDWQRHTYWPLMAVSLAWLAAYSWQVIGDLHGTPEVVVNGVTGLLVPPGDPVRLAGALVELAGDSARRERMGAAARRLVVELFDIEHHVARHAALYVDLVARKRGAA